MKIFIISFLLGSCLLAQTVTDMQGRSVTVAKTAKVAAVGPGALRLLTYMQCDSRLAGIERIELGFEKEAPYRRALDMNKVRALPVIGQGGPGRMPNIEALIQSGAQIVFTSFLSRQQNDMLSQKSNLPVIALSYGAGYGGSKDRSKLASIQQSLRLLGRIFNKQERAGELVSFMQTNQNLLRHIYDSHKEAYIGATGYKGARGILASQNGYEPFVLLGLQNALAPNQRGSFTTSYEALLQKNPETIFVDWLGKSIVQEEFENKRPILQALRAHKEKNIFWLYPYNYYNTNIENIFINAFIIADKLGVSIDTKAVAGQIYATFLPRLTADDIITLPKFTW